MLLHEFPYFLCQKISIDTNLQNAPNIFLGHPLLLYFMIISSICDIMMYKHDPLSIMKLNTLHHTPHYSQGYAGRLTLPASPAATSPCTWPASRDTWAWWASSSPGPPSSSRSPTTRAERVSTWQQHRDTMTWSRYSHHEWKFVYNLK